MLLLNCDLRESIYIGDSQLKASSNTIASAAHSPEDVVILREEIYQRIMTREGIKGVEQA